MPCPILLTPLSFADSNSLDRAGITAAEAKADECAGGARQEASG